MYNAKTCIVADWNLQVYKLSETTLPKKKEAHKVKEHAFRLRDRCSICNLHKEGDKDNQQIHDVNMERSFHILPSYRGFAYLGTKNLERALKTYLYGDAK